MKTKNKMKQFYSVSGDINQLLNEYRNPRIPVEEILSCTLNWLTYTMQCMINDGERPVDALAFIMIHMSTLYQISNEIFYINPMDTVRIDTLARACYDIDIGLVEKLGVEDFPSPHTNDVHEKTLRERGYTLFKNSMTNSYLNIRESTDRRFLTAWACITYNCMYNFHPKLFKDMIAEIREDIL